MRARLRNRVTGLCARREASLGLDQLVQLGQVEIVVEGRQIDVLPGPRRQVHRIGQPDAGEPFLGGGDQRRAVQGVGGEVLAYVW